MLPMDPSGLALERACAATLIMFSPWPYCAAWRGRREVHNCHSQCTCTRAHAENVCRPSPYVHAVELCTVSYSLDECMWVAGSMLQNRTPACSVL